MAPVVQGSWQESSRLSVNQAKRKVKQNITTGLIQGKGYDQISRQVSKDMEMGLNRANRIVRTESHRAREQGKYDSMKEGEELGVKQKKRWLATLDDATRDSHQDLDGVTIDVDKDFEGEDGKGPAPGQLGSAREDINCRCTLLTIVEDYEPEKRRARDEGMSEYKDYEDYADKKMDQKHKPISQEDEFYQDLETKEARIVDQDYETAHVYDENDDYLFEKDGNRDSVPLTSQEVTQMHGGTLSHNHPLENAFSRADVKFARTSRLKEMRAVDNNYLHVVKPKNGSWERSMGVFKGSDGVERNFTEVINKVHEDVRRDFTELIQNGDMLVSTAEREHFHELWTRVQRETDAIEYSRVRR